MDWVSNPAWWALIVAIIGTTANGAFNWLNWKRSAVPKFQVEILEAQRLEQMRRFVLKNTGSRPISHPQLHLLRDDPGMQVLLDNRPDLESALTPQLGQYAQERIAPGDYVVFVFEGDIYPQQVGLTCDELPAMQILPMPPLLPAS